MNAADRTAALAMRWVHYYTRRLPVGVSQARRDELAADLWEHSHHARSSGVPDAVIACRSDGVS